jgi:tellurite resistance protein TerC
MAQTLDNIFLINLIFAYFKVPLASLHRVLFWGILGVIVLRGAMIGAGAALISQFNWILYIFAAFLIITGAKMLIPADGDQDIGDNVAVRFMRKHLPMTGQFHGEAFFVRMPDPHTGKIAILATPLFAALVTIEFVDVVFALDSVPAIFTITHRLYLEHLRYPRLANALLRACSGGPPLQLSSICARHRPYLHRSKGLPR